MRATQPEFLPGKCSRCSTIHFFERLPYSCHVCGCIDGDVLLMQGEEADSYRSAYALGGKDAVMALFAARYGIVGCAWNVGYDLDWRPR